MRSKIIVGFPGVGKTECKRLLGERAIDADSSMYSWTWEGGGKVRNPAFPKNYIDHIKGKIGKREYIFVSTHKEVLDALLDACLFFYLVYPDPTDKDDYLQRYRERGDDQSFIDSVGSNWRDWIRELDKVGHGCLKVKMQRRYLIDVIERLDNLP